MSSASQTNFWSQCRIKNLGIFGVGSKDILFALGYVKLKGRTSVLENREAMAISEDEPAIGQVKKIRNPRESQRLVPGEGVGEELKRF